MSESADKINTINIITHINELMSQTEVTQYFKNTKKNPIELEMVIPKLSNCNITRFEMIKNNKKVVSKLLEKEKAKEKYNDTITTGNYGFISYNEEHENKICLGNIQPNEEIELTTFYFGHIINKDLSYQASFPVIFPNFIMGDPNSKEEQKNILKIKKVWKLIFIKIIFLLRISLVLYYLEQKKLMMMYYIVNVIKRKINLIICYKKL